MWPPEPVLGSNSIVECLQEMAQAPLQLAKTMHPTLRLHFGLQAPLALALQSLLAISLVRTPTAASSWRQITRPLIAQQWLEIINLMSHEIKACGDVVIVEYPGERKGTRRRTEGGRVSNGTTYERAIPKAESLYCTAWSQAHLRFVIS